MTSKRLERAAYFDGELLGAADFRTDQRYFESLSEARNRAVHTAGIVDGLLVSAGPRAGTVVVSPGIAVDALGRALVLVEARSAEVPDAPATAFYVMLTASARPSEATSQSGARGYKRDVLDPRLEISADGAAEGASQVVLGRVLVDARGAIRAIDLRVRVYTGTAVGSATFVSGDPSGRSLPSIHASRAEPAGVVLHADAARTTFIGSLQIAGSLGVNVEIPHAQIDVGSSLGPAAPVVALRVDPSAETFFVTAAGDVGIGVAAPSARLEVAGDVLLDRGASIRFAQDEANPITTIGVRGTAPQPRMTFTSGSMNLTAPTSIRLQAGSGPAQVVLHDNGHATIGEVADRPDATLSVRGRIRTLRGGLLFPDGVLQTTAALSTIVPIGAIIDWWMPADVGLPLPPEFQVCDGSLSKATSGPMAGKHVPDLRGLFVRGTTQYGNIGQPSGAAQHDHPITTLPTHTHAIAHTHPDLVTSSGPQTTSPDSWGDKSELAQRDHQHPMTIVIGQSTTAQSGDSSPVTGASTLDADNLPPYFSLVKVIRIR
ncbi:hypothetical protein WME79_17140 [Sorangium sp. So ce726]|uniref:hypothetical protein n=1 Tax=Sorangium sp. So ce726 TaxID=3133319 RepID=UPI003F63B23D